MIKIMFAALLFLNGCVANVREATPEEIEQESKYAQTLAVFEQFADDIVLHQKANGLLQSIPKAKLGKEFSIHKAEAVFDGVIYHYYINTPVANIYFLNKENAEQYLKTLLTFVATESKHKSQ